MKAEEHHLPDSSQRPQMLDIRWEDGFEASLAQAIPDPELRAEVIESIEWILAWLPKARSAPVGLGGYRVFATEATARAPRIRICFRIEGELLAFCLAST
jgi:hypothetical protein